MDIRSSLDGLKSILGVNPSPQPTTASTRAATAQPTSIGADSATVSSAGSEVLQSAGEDGVRSEKVAAIQAALADGSYNVPTSAVASKVVDAMLGGDK
jgi:negative regulator of flagellin synthesis FlgM